MHKKSIQLTIPTPCPQRWQDMEASETGRFCANYQKTVQDFTTMSDQQMADYFLNQPNNVCGRFTTEQLDRVLNTGFSVRTNSWSQRWIGLVAASLISWSTNQAYSSPLFTNRREINKEISPDTTDRTIANEGFLETSTNTDSLRVVKGQVISSVDNKPLAGVIIKVKGSSGETFTDTSGLFNLSIPNYQGDKLTVVVGTIGFTRQEIEVPASRNKPLLVNLYEDTTLLGEVVYTPQKPSFLKRLRNQLRTSR